MKILLVTLLAFITSHISAQPISVGTELKLGDVPAHDPVMIKQDSVYYLFCTGMGISVWSSKDMRTWKKEKQVFDTPPEWAVKAVPGYRGHTWAPDITCNNGKYYLYYSVSQFGKNTSCIGVAVNKSLHPNSPDFKWEDKGKVIQSVPGRDLWNAIDPNLITDDSSRAWLNFGSWWGGIKMFKLSADLTAPAEPQEWYTLARRPREYFSNDASGGGAAIEAPFIYKKGKYYYLFVSFDLCCQGEKSTYKVMVGRSEKVTGPYIDKEGVRMDRNGGSLVLQGDSSWHGAGHNAVYNFNGKDYIIFHGYDAKDKGRSKLRIEELEWDKAEWPMIKTANTSSSFRRGTTKQSNL
jgi:arabinan endo-1,5-alpha-L-arabinosidase